jgi:hypothetical protein
MLLALAHVAAGRLKRGLLFFHRGLN